MHIILESFNIKCPLSPGTTLIACARFCVLGLTKNHRSFSNHRQHFSNHTDSKRVYSEAYLCFAEVQRLSRPSCHLQPTLRFIAARSQPPHPTAFNVSAPRRSSACCSLLTSCCTTYARPVASKTYTRKNQY